MTIPCQFAFTTIAQLEAHIAAHHEDMDVDRWPDGGLVVYRDATPEDITGGAE
jgi:hypothetical protein